MWNINIILTMSIINVDTTKNYYAGPIYVLKMIFARFIAAVLAAFFLSLLRSSKLTISQYMYVRFKKIQYLVIVDLVTLLLVFKSFMQSIAMLERLADAVKFTESVQILIWFLYSIALVLIGGMRGWLWIGMFRFVIIFVCEITIVLYIPIISKANYKFEDFTEKTFYGTSALTRKGASSAAYRMDAAMSFIYDFFYNLSLLLLTDFSKYISCNKKGKSSNWTIVLHVIPFSIILLCQGIVALLMFIKFYPTRCDPVGGGDKARYLLLYAFIDSISEKPPNLPLHMIICVKSFLLSISTMPDIILTFYEKLHFILSKMETFKGAKRRKKFYVGHIIISIAIVYISLNIFFKYQSGGGSSVSQVMLTAIFISSLLTTAVVFSSAMIPQLNANIFIFVPFFTFLVTLANYNVGKGETKAFGNAYADFCGYMSECKKVEDYYSKCSFPCSEWREDYFVTLVFMTGFLIIFGFSLFTTTVGKLTLKQMDPTLYIPCMLSFWQKRYASSFPQPPKPFKIIERHMT